MSSLNIFHLVIFSIGLIFVIFVSVNAGRKKLENEKYWIAMIAFTAFSMYCVIDYDPINAKFCHPCPHTCCYSSPQSK